MKEYNVHFSHYSEEYGSFEVATIKVDAADQFEARSKAWKLSENHAELEFASCIKLCGITWEASKLDMQDYFNAAAAADKYMIQYIENVQKPNAQIAKDDKKYEDCERERYSNFGSLYAISHIAEDLGKPLGMIPPAVFEELHYAEEFAYTLVGEFDKSSAMLKQIERAENWDSTAIFGIRELFKNGYGMAGGYELNFSAQFGKDGLYPVSADRTDYESKYVSRWTNAREYKKLDSLPFFSKNDIIPGSQSMQYEWQSLVINKESLSMEKQKPENSLWAMYDDPHKDEDDPDRWITVQNLITDELEGRKRSDFIGVLRPEINAKINVEAIKTEYQVRKAEKDHSADNKMPLFINRIKQNMSDYNDFLSGLTKQELNDIYEKTDVIKEAYHYLLTIKPLTDSEIESLLRFSNPLKIVAEVYQNLDFSDVPSDVKFIDMQTALDKVLENYKDCTAGYALMPNLENSSNINLSKTDKKISVDDVKPSILKTVEENKNKIAQNDQPGKQKKKENSLE